MKPEDVYKALDKLCENKKEELHMTNAELSEKLYDILDTELGDVEKSTNYGDDYTSWTFEYFDHELRKSDAERDYDYIFEYCYEIFVYEICNFCGCGCVLFR